MSDLVDEPTVERDPLTRKRLDHARGVTLEDAYSEGLEDVAGVATQHPRDTNPANAIRRACLQCTQGHKPLIADCHITHCALWPYRHGRNPFHASARKA